MEYSAPINNIHYILSPWIYFLEFISFLRIELLFLLVTVAALQPMRLLLSHFLSDNLVLEYITQSKGEQNNPFVSATVSSYYPLSSCFIATPTPQHISKADSILVLPPSSHRSAFGPTSPPRQLPQGHQCTVLLVLEVRPSPCYRGSESTGVHQHPLISEGSRALTFSCTHVWFNSSIPSPSDLFSEARAPGVVRALPRYYVHAL